MPLPTRPVTPTVGASIRLLRPVLLPRPGWLDRLFDRIEGWGT